MELLKVKRKEIRRVKEENTLMLIKTYLLLA